MRFSGSPRNGSSAMESEQKIKSEDIWLAATKMFRASEIKQMSKAERRSLILSLMRLLERTPNPSEEELTRHKERLLKTVLHPALTNTWRINEALANAKATKGE
jgi:hypothetical protein